MVPVVVVVGDVLVVGVEVVVGEVVADVVAVDIRHSLKSPAWYKCTARFNAEAVASQVVVSAMYFPWVHLTSSDLPPGPVIAVTTALIPSAASEQLSPAAAS